MSLPGWAVERCVGKVDPADIPWQGSSSYLEGILLFICVKPGVLAVASKVLHEVAWGPSWVHFLLILPCSPHSSPLCLCSPQQAGHALTAGPCTVCPSSWGAQGPCFSSADALSSLKCSLKSRVPKEPYPDHLFKMATASLSPTWPILSPLILTLLSNRNYWLLTYYVFLNVLYVSLLSVFPCYNVPFTRAGICCWWLVVHCCIPGI